MAKCIKLNDGKVVRVSNEVANELVSKDKGNYTNKDEYKRQLEGKESK
jgi:Tfp pilus assembly protein PilP